MRNHIFSENFSAEIASRRAPLIMYFVACIIKNVPYEKKIDPKEYTDKTFVDNGLKSIREQRKVNPIGYAYAIKADGILHNR